MLCRHGVLRNHGEVGTQLRRLGDHTPRLRGLHGSLTADLRDGRQLAVGLTAPLIVTQADPYLTVAPYIQVSVGYAGEEAANWARLRNRDLVPPGEPVGDEMMATLAAARDSGAMTQEYVDAYLEELADTHGDVFLDFLTNELHPRLYSSELRVSESGHGLFGYSYGAFSPSTHGCATRPHSRPSVRVVPEL